MKYAIMAIGAILLVVWFMATHGAKIPYLQGNITLPTLSHSSKPSPKPSPAPHVHGKPLHKNVAGEYVRTN